MPGSTRARLFACVRRLGLSLSAMKRDYYEILGVPPEATQEEIQRAYRRKAFELHPDRNGGSREAEEAFKALTEAYAVLRKPEARTRYEETRSRGTTGFDPTDALRDLFADPYLGSLFSQLAREMDRQGLRFDEAYLRQVFGRGSGGAFMGGFVFVGPWGPRFGSRPRRPSAEPQGVGEPPALTRRRGLLGRLLDLALPAPDRGRTLPGDIRYTLPLAPETLKGGGTVRISVPGNTGRQIFDVRVPPGARDGTRLRLAGKGHGTEGRGDLYLEIRESS